MSPSSTLEQAFHLEILRSLDEVGRSKAVGYLPIYTIKYILGENLDIFREIFLQRGLGVILFDKRRTCIKSGALYVFDAALVDPLIQVHREALEGKGWAPDSVTIIGNLAREWYDKDDPIMPLIRDLFGDRPWPKAGQAGDV